MTSRERKLAQQRVLAALRKEQVNVRQLWHDAEAKRLAWRIAEAAVQEASSLRMTLVEVDVDPDVIAGIMTTTREHVDIIVSSQKRHHADDVAAAVESVSR